MTAEQAAGLYERLPRLNIRFHIFVVVGGVNEHHVKAGVPDGLKYARGLKRRRGARDKLFRFQCEPLDFCKIYHIHSQSAYPLDRTRCSSLPLQVSTARIRREPSMLSAMAVVERPIHEPTSTMRTEAWMPSLASHSNSAGFIHPSVASAFLIFTRQSFRACALPWLPSSVFLEALSLPWT